MFPLPAGAGAGLVSFGLWFRCLAIESGWYRGWWWPREIFGHLSEVLGGCGEEDFVAGAAEAPEPEAIELEDAFEVSKSHFNLLALVA